MTNNDQNATMHEKSQELLKILEAGGVLTSDQEAILAAHILFCSECREEYYELVTKK